MMALGSHGIGMYSEGLTDAGAEVIRLDEQRGKVVDVFQVGPQAQIPQGVLARMGSAEVRSTAKAAGRAMASKSLAPKKISGASTLRYPALTSVRRKCDISSTFLGLVASPMAPRNLNKRGCSGAALSSTTTDVAD